MSGNDIASNNSLSIRGVNASNVVLYGEYVKTIAMAAVQKLEFPPKANKYFTNQQLMTLYNAQIRLQLEYCSYL